MRLLHVHTFEFEQFENSPPKYAILSHRWTKSEAKLEDVQHWRRGLPSTHAKVLGFTNYVRLHLPDVEWIWIDSCCINQHSAAELNEGVNRMFSWYRDATLCLALLPDVENTSDWVALRRSIWFKRGWTLQELIASRTVVFLTKDWQAIGHKGAVAHLESIEVGPNLEPLLSEVTGVPQDVLQDFSNSQRLGVREKMLWIDGRQTLKEEDMIYALFGIFGVSPGANYGEGIHNAELRLKEAIERRDSSGILPVDLNGLKTAEGAAFNSYKNENSTGCLEGTRVDLLQQVQDWANDHNGKRFFWLCGKAGTGKSTIASTVGHILHNSSCLGASFFFKRGEGDRGNASRFFSTIARQLTDRFPNARQAVAAALHKESDVCEQSLQQQFDKLLVQPFSSMSGSGVPHQNTIIVIDAIDECRREEDLKQEDVSKILRLLAKADTIKTLRLRIFVTSRPELSVQLGFKDIDKSSHHDVMLEEVQATTIRHDIRTFFDHRFSKMRTTSEMSLAPLPSDWPGHATIQMLVDRAVPLFIFASTVCLYIEQDDHRECLSTVLKHPPSGSFTGLAGLYLPILREAISRPDSNDQTQAVKRFKSIVGAIVLLIDSLSAASLSSLLDVPVSRIASSLDKLHSLLSITRNGPIKLLHLSFRDFLVNIDHTVPGRPRAEEFHISEPQTHAWLATQCIRHLERPGLLRQDALGIDKHGIRRTDVDKQSIANHIPAETMYACSYWAHHLVLGQEVLIDNGQVHRFLLRHFLHWLEMLSWMGRLRTAIEHLTQLRLRVQTNGVELSALLEDALRFTSLNQHVIDLAPLQLYHSALLFAPTESIVRKTLLQSSDQVWELLSPAKPYWSSELLRIEGHAGIVNDIAISPDGRAIVSAAEDTCLKVWNTATGEEIQHLAGHDNWVGAAAYSPDGLIIASASLDKTIKLWDAREGRLRTTIEAHDDWVNAVQFSPDGSVFASGSRDKTVKLWHSATGSEIQRLEGHDGWIRSVSFSLDGRLIASGSGDTTIRIWSTANGEEIHILTGHSDWVNAVTFSPIDNMLASASGDKTVRLWNGNTGTELRLFLGHDDWVNAVAFSPDARTIASCSHDHTVRLWDAATGHEVQVFNGHDQWINAVAFSPNGRILASASADSTIRLWYASLRNVTSLRSQEQRTCSVRYSSDGQMLASGCHDGSVKLWDATNGREMLSFAGHSDPVWTLAFSPDRQHLASASTDQMVRLWNTTTGEETQHISMDGGYIDKMCYVDDHNIKLTTNDRRSRWWNLTTNRIQEDFCILAQTDRGTCSDLDLTAAEIPRLRTTPYDKMKADLEQWSVSGQWIRFNNEDVLWLPHEYRGTCVTWYGSTIALGQRFGDLTLLKRSPRYCQKA